MFKKFIIFTTILLTSTKCFALDTGDLNVNGDLTLKNITSADVLTTDSDGKVFSGTIDLTPYVPYVGATGSVDLGSQAIMAGTGTFGTTTLSGDTIINSTGTISFDNENLTTTGTLGAGATTLTGALAMGGNAITNAGAITGTSFIIGANTLDTSEWANLDGQNQTVATTSSPTFANVSVTPITLGTEKFGATFTKGTGWSESPAGTFIYTTGAGTLSQTVANMASAPVVGETYQLTWNVTAFIGSNFEVKAFGGVFNINSAGVKTYQFKATSASTPVFTITPPATGTWNCTIKSLSFKKVTNGSGSIAQDLTVTRYLKGANYSAFLEVKYGAGGGGDENHTLEDGFTRVLFSTYGDYGLTDPGNNYDAVNNRYIVPVSGIYKVTTKLRVSDDNGSSFSPSYYSFDSVTQEFPQYVSYGQGADTSEGDSATFMWFSTQDYRNGSMNTRISHFNQGDEIVMFTYADTPIPSSDGSMNIELLYAD